MTPITLFRPAASVLLFLLLPGLAPAQSYPYRAIDLGVPPGQSPTAGVGASAIGLAGDVVGGTSVWEPYVWERGRGMRALAKLGSLPNGTVHDVNDAGFAVGSCGLPTVSIPTTAVRWDPQGNVQAIPGLGGMFSSCVGINNAGTVIGGSELTVGGVRYSHAFRWTQAGGTVDLTPGLAGNSAALDINDAGQICLQSGSGAFRLTPGVGLQSTGGVLGHRINRYGQMAGKDMATGTAGRYTDGIGWEMFGAGAQVALSHIGGINGLGQVVGTQSILQNPSPPSYERRGQLWTEGLGFQRLDDWIDPAQQVRVKWVHGITDAGVILAEGSIGPDNRALLLEPTSVSLYGAGCASAGGGTPKLGAAGWPRRGGDLVVLAGGGPAGGAGLFVLSLTTSAVPLPGGCSLLVDPVGAAVTLAALNPIGQGALRLRVPATMPPLPVFAQFLTLDPTGTRVDTSNGVRVDIR